MKNGWMDEKARSNSLQETHFTDKVVNGLKVEDRKWNSKQLESESKHEYLHSYLTKQFSSQNFSEEIKKGSPY
jgi:hypothetical protein